MRLDRFLSNMGEGSRKDIKKLTSMGSITVNGVRAKKPSMNIDEVKDTVAVNGTHIPYEPFIYLMLNKPAGVLSATEDRKGETVLDIIQHKRKDELFPVGRLDKDTEGLLLLTNDGPLAHDLLSPKRHVPKTYFANIKGKVEEVHREIFESGITLEDGTLCMPADLEILKCETGDGDVHCDVMVTIYEGKFHQVKRMFQAIGTEVTYLKRISMGGLPLDSDLALGEWRPLTTEDLKKLRNEIC